LNPTATIENSSVEYSTIKPFSANNNRKYLIELSEDGTFVEYESN